MGDVVGLVLAAGAGSRMGRPKALVTDDDGTPWLGRAVGVLRDGGRCTDLLVVLGAGADDARALVPDDTRVVVADDWAEGMGASLRTGLRTLLETSDAVAALVTLVDLPDVNDGVARRVFEVLPLVPATTALARATFGGEPGHPVLLGREHWAAVADEVAGDTGARDYLDRHDTVAVPCDDLATGRDQDEPTAGQRDAP